MAKIHLILLLPILLGLTACGGPRYTLITEHVAPAGNPAANACLAGCNTDQQVCADGCDERHRDCLATKEEEAKLDYPAKAEAAAARREAFYTEQRLYEEKLRNYEDRRTDLLALRSLHGDKCRSGKKVDRKYHCEQERDAAYRYKDLRKPKAPVKPGAFTLQSHIRSYQALCRSECGCQEHFDRCFVSCGGRIETRRICVDNCE